MAHLSQNGNGGATIPPVKTPRVISGSGLANRKLDKRQRAILAAGVLDGSVRFEPSITQLAALFGVSTTYIMMARKLGHPQQHAIMKGWNDWSFAKMLPPRATKSPEQLVPAITDETPKEVISDGDIEDMIRKVGVERVLDAAVQVDR